MINLTANHKPFCLAIMATCNGYAGLKFLKVDERPQRPEAFATGNTHAQVGAFHFNHRLTTGLLKFNYVMYSILLSQAVRSNGAENSTPQCTIEIPNNRCSDNRLPTGEVE